MPITASKITRSNFKLARLHTNEHPVGKKTGVLREEREVECQEEVRYLQKRFKA